jgi:PAS domain S-box-containing protein
MQAPCLPENENERLAALKELDLLDTQAEEVFDDFTFLASHICEAPIAIITLLDETRQWFKSKVGLDAIQTPREISFCGHALLQDDIFEITDALADERFADNPLVVGEPHIRHYAGALIRTKEGHKLGTLCVIDTKPKKLNETQRNALKKLAYQVTTQIELKRSYKKHQELNELLSDSLTFIRNVIDNLPATIGYWDKNLVCTFANKTYADKYLALGVEIIGKRLFEAVSKELMQQIKPHVDGVLAGKAQQFETHFTAAGQQVVHTQVNYIPDFDTNKEVKGFYIFAIDVSDLRKAQEDNKLAEVALATAGTGILITNAQHEIISINHTFAKMTGYDQSELVGKTPDFIFHEECINAAIESLNNNHDWHGEGRYRKKSGEYVDYLGSVIVMKDESGQTTHHLATIQDLTEKLRLSQELANSREMLERTGKIANIGGWEFDITTGLGRWTKQVALIHELDPEIPASVELGLSFYPEEAKEIIAQAFNNCVEHGTPYDLELPFITAKGNKIWVRTIGESVQKNGKNVKVVGTFQDITEKKHAEQASIAKEIALRRTVVREVHHHIKNNIQGISGILHNAVHLHPELTIPLNETISQLESVAVIHGLQGKSLESAIEIKELTMAIRQNVERIWRSNLIFEAQGDWVNCHLTETEAVPIALILSELMTNASKHSLNNAPIQISIKQSPTHNGRFEVTICIVNDGEFSPPTLPNQTGHFGLKLIAALMPKVGAQYHIAQENTQTRAMLALKYPVIKT